MGNSASDIGKGLGHGLLGLVGAGDAYDPLGDLRSSLSTATSALQNAQNLGPYLYATNDLNFEKWKTKMDQGQANIIEEQMKYFNNLANNQLEDINYFLVLLFLLIIIIIFFLLIK
jgi:hypothetical protein